MEPAEDNLLVFGDAEEAIVSARLDELRLLIRAHDYLLGMTVSGVNLLMRAAREGQDAVCSYLLDLQDVNFVSDRGNMALEYAAGWRRASTVDLLLRAGAWVDSADISIVTPLMAAAIEGDLDIVKLLLDAGAELNREHLREPMTATAWAEFYLVTKQPGLPEVAAFLRERGGINPFNEGPHDWTGVVGEPCVKLVEGHLGPVHPWPIEREVRPGEKLTIRRSRFAPKAPRRFYFHLLFTVDLGPRAGVELAVCLPREWPLHDRALKKDEFRMPLDLLCQLGSALLSGRRLAHGDLLTRDDPAFAGLAMQERLDQWLCVQHQSIEEQRWREPEAKPLLLLVPNLAKTRIKPGKDALAKADAKAQLPWNLSAAKEGRNALVVPLSYDAPWIQSPLRWS